MNSLPCLPDGIDETCERVHVDMSGDVSNFMLSERLWSALRHDAFTARLRQIAWDAFRSRSGSSSSSSSSSKHNIKVPGNVHDFLDETGGGGLKDLVCNLTLRLFERNAAAAGAAATTANEQVAARKSQDESLPFIRAARLAWEQGINEELLTVVKEAKKPFIIFRPTDKKCPYLDQQENNSGLLGNQEEVRFLFDGEDLMETALCIRNNNAPPHSFERMFSALKFELPTATLDDLIRRYAVLGVSHVQVGADDAIARYGHRFCILRHDEGEAVVARCNPAEAREYLRGGALPALRAKLWRVALGLPALLSEQEQLLHADLRAECDRLDMVTDELYLHDVQIVLDDPRFFPFEEELNCAVLCFVRDAGVRAAALYEVHEPILGGANGHGVGAYPAFRAVVTGSGDGAAPLASPPSAVQPFLGLASYFAPLCFLYAQKPAMYTVARALWCKLWCKLNVLSGDEGTLLHVCKTFENLLAMVHPRLCLHLIALGLPPLHVAFGWIHVGFVGFLEMDQLLLLWDRVIGYTDTTLLAVLACAVFVHRAEVLFMPGMTADKATLILNEGSRLRVIPLLQMFLYAT